jgi:isopentenyl-diphosphate delta-isomerase
LSDSVDRKDSHLKECLESEVEFRSDDANGFGSLRFDHDALPEISKNSVSTEIKLFGKNLAAPFFIGAMTGGTSKAGEINKRLAQAAEKCQIGFALGSQRKMIEDPTLSSTFDVKKFAPLLPLLIGNIGAVQLNYGVGVEQILKIIAEVKCDAFNFHLNPLQEAIQPEGNTDFSKLLSKLSELIPLLKVPVLIKEVGAGISETTALKLQSLPIAGVETAGLGGTSWAKIESLRTSDSQQRSVGETFARWGIPTAESVVICRKYFPNQVVIASGGMRNGIEAAKAIALGADAVGFALPILKAAEKSVDEAVRMIERFKEELRTVMFLTSSSTIYALKKVKLKKLFDYVSINEK